MTFSVDLEPQIIYTTIMAKPRKKQTWNPEWDKNRPGMSFQLRLPPELNQRIDEQSTRHKTTKSAIILSGAEHIVTDLEKATPLL